MKDLSAQLETTRLAASRATVADFLSALVAEPTKQDCPSVPHIRHRSAR